MNDQSSTPGPSPLSLETSTAAVTLVLGVLYGIAALGEGLGSMADSGAGLFPFGVAVVLVIASAVVLVQEARGTSIAGPADEDDEEFHGDVDWLRIGGVLATSLLVPLVGSTIGLITTLSVVTAVIARIMGLSGWRRPVLLGAGFGVAAWLIFVQWLYVPLPAGRLGLI